MKRLIFLLQFLLFYRVGSAQNSYFQQEVNYNIDVSLNDTDNTLTGFEVMDYKNNSPDTLYFIWIHLWPNAYKNDRTAFSEQMLRLGRTDFYFSNEADRGYINKLNFTVNGAPARLETDSQHIDVAKLFLPEPLFPQKTVRITTPFFEKLPYNFSRGGHVGQTYQVTQWYPKPAVYDRKGWHPMPYLDQGEFYSEFGNYRVRITVPAGYTVAATGQSSTTETRDSLVTGRNMPLPSVTFTFSQQNVHDFAWFADRNFVESHDTLQLSGSRIVQVYSFATKDDTATWRNSVDYIKNSVRAHSSWLGNYPYSSVTAIEAQMGFDGGMEYPTITSISKSTDAGSLEDVIEHEVGHNWLYGILATNERKFPWMDEGMNTYYDNRYAQLHREDNNGEKIPGFVQRRLPDDFYKFLYRVQLSEKKDQPILTSSDKFSAANYIAIAYYKSALWMKNLQEFLGKSTFDSCMHQYYREWQFKHPYPEDFQRVMETVSGKNLDSNFSLLSQKGAINPPVRKELKIDLLGNLHQTDKHSYLFLSPAAGVNYYDKIMVGILVHNYTLPEPKFHFFAIPLYATGSKKFGGLARAGYNNMSYGPIRKTEISLSAEHFSMDEFTDSTGRKNYLSFSKIVPSVKITFRNNDPTSRVHKWIQWKTYLISESSLEFSYDSARQEEVITYPATPRYLNQLRLVLGNDRVLYPYSTSIVAQQATDFVRLGFEGKYFFNYANGDGLNTRLFLGKFIYLGQQTVAKKFATDRYHLNMTGADGYEDYTYSNYFLGRNEFQNATSQQIMIRDGGFKVRTDLLNQKVGKTDDWLAAINLSSAIPSKVNPLELLPLKIPVLVFCDIGTYAESWKTNPATGRFIYDAGLQLSLLKNLVNIYVPLVYSKVYADYFKSTLGKNRFFKTISFSIDIQNFRPDKFLNIPHL